jgi:hypothetical protein
VRKLSFVSLVNATGINLKILQAVLFSLLSTELDLLIARLILASAICHVFKRDLLSISSPCVRKYRIRRDCLVAN